MAAVQVLANTVANEVGKLGERNENL
jgi:hypothetical protein